MKNEWSNTFNFKSLIERNETIVGVLNPIKWDLKGNIKQYSIYSDEEEDIIIEGIVNERRLRRLLNRRVLAEGKVRINEDGDKILRLKRIHELTGPTSPAVSTVKAFDSGMWNEEYSVSIPKEYALAQYNQVGESYLEAC